MIGVIGKRSVEVNIWDTDNALWNTRYKYPYLVLAAQRHDGVQAFGDAMLGFVVPLTIVTLGVTMLRRAGR